MTITWEAGLALVELSVMEQRYRAVLEVEAGCPVVEVAERHGVSRQSVHAWVRRYRASGLAGLADRSHRPAECPHQTAGAVEALVCELRRSHPRWGPQRLAYELEQRDVVPVPSLVTLYRILVRNGLVVPGARRRPRSSYARWQREVPMELWQLDIMGGAYAVSALHRRTNGTLDAILVDGGHNVTLDVSSLRLLARAEQPCGNHHTPGPCHRCENAVKPVTAQCDVYRPGDTCKAPATMTLRWTDPCGSHTAHRCHEHGTRDCTITITATPVPAGTSAYERSLKRSPVAVCRGCGHSISHIDGEWISGPVTACPGLEHGPHQPAVIRREAHLASDARPCRRSEPHDLTRC